MLLILALFAVNLAIRCLRRISGRRSGARFYSNGRVILQSKQATD